MVLHAEKPGELQGKRATTRICEIHVAAGNSLHGKEAALGSSPGEGFNTCKSPVFDDYRVPLRKAGARGRVSHDLKNSLQIARVIRIRGAPP
jgi:hypothetical protein